MHCILPRGTGRGYCGFSHTWCTKPWSTLYLERKGLQHFYGINSTLHLQHLLPYYVQSSREFYFRCFLFSGVLIFADRPKSPVRAYFNFRAPLFVSCDGFCNKNLFSLSAYSLPAENCFAYTLKRLRVITCAKF